jgi:N-hydroxyarylamine O-acetyltransferase
VRVTADNGVWLADIGFAAGLLEPLPWADGAVPHQGGWTYRLVADDGWQLQERLADDWTPLYELADETAHAIDIEVANHFTATHPSSPFVGKLVLMTKDDHRRTRLVDRTLDTLHANGKQHEPHDQRQRNPTLLRNTFGIHLTDADASAPMAS